MTTCGSFRDSLPIAIVIIRNRINSRWMAKVLGQKFSSSSDSNRPGQAGPAQAWPGLAYGGAEEARPIGP